MFADRLDRLSAQLSSAGLPVLAVVPGANMRYLAGLSFHLSERAAVAFFAPGRKPLLVVPALERGKAEGAPFPVDILTWTDDDGPAAAFDRARDVLALTGRKLGVEGRRMRFLELALLRDAEPVNADPVLAVLRMRKDAAEIDAMRAAVAIAEQAIRNTLPRIRAGVTEREVAAELVLQLLRGGSGPMPFEPIVATGLSGANPHAVPTDRAIQPGDLITIDWGASVDGYFSDITRTYAVGEPSAELRRIYATVQAANAAGRAACGPGITSHSVDRATRAVTEQAGLAEYFIHRTGHGLGLEAHEEPDIKTGVELVLEPGMTFTVEPGVYLPGLSGARIEDDMLITAGGAESLTTLPRDLMILGA